MTIHQAFLLSACIGLTGWIGFLAENLSGRMTRFTRWSQMTNRQWVFVYMMLQFAAAIAVMVLYYTVKRAA